MPYRAPVSDFRFLLDHIVGFSQVTATDRFADATPDMTLAILTFLYAWNDYLWPLVSAQQREYFTITLGLASIQSNFAQSEGLGRVMASGVIASLPVVILFLIFQRYVVQAMTVGGSKG